MEEPGSLTRAPDLMHIDMIEYRGPPSDRTLADRIDNALLGLGAQIYASVS